MAAQTKKKALLAIAAVVLVAISYFGYQYFTYVKSDNAQVEAHSVMLAAKVGGYVTTVNVVEGQRVKKGDLLVEIDKRDYENTLLQVKGELTSVEARKRDAEKNLGRISQLYKSGAVSQQQFDQSSAAFAEVNAKYEAVAAQVDQAQLNLENTSIRAPSDGFIAKRSVEVGQLASPGVPLIGFVDASERWVTANLKETEVEGVHVGSSVEVQVDAISDKDFHGKVVAVSSATGATFALLPPDNATGNFTKVVQRIPIKIELENLSERDVESLRAGLSAVVKVRKR
jgi:membrane fusion protein (multidrug efflux system)